MCFANSAFGSSKYLCFTGQKLSGIDVSKAIYTAPSSAVDKIDTEWACNIYTQKAKKGQTEQKNRHSEGMKDDQN